VLANANNRRRGLAAIAAASVIAIAGCGDEEPTEPAAAAPSAPPAEEALEGTTVGAASEEPKPPAEELAPDPAPIPESEKEDMAEQAVELPHALETIESYFTSNDPKLVCGSLVTEAFLTDSFGGKEGCVLAQPSIVPSTDVQVLDDFGAGEERLTVAVVPKGGVYGGQEVDVTLLLVDGAYRIDRLRSQVPVGP
jgi:hypothetical protein